MGVLPVEEMNAEFARGRRVFVVEFSASRK
jgi:hypothetical protein